MWGRCCPLFDVCVRSGTRSRRGSSRPPQAQVALRPSILRWKLATRPGGNCHADVPVDSAPANSGNKHPYRDETFERHQQLASWRARMDALLSRSIRNFIFNTLTTVSAAYPHATPDTCRRGVVLKNRATFPGRRLLRKHETFRGPGAKELSFSGRLPRYRSRRFGPEQTWTS